MIRQSFNSLLVASLLGFASCGATQLGAATHKESISSSALLALTSVEVLTHTYTDSNSISPPGDLDSWKGQRKAVDLTTPFFLPTNEVIIDLGVGEAPYDDGFLDYALDFSPLVGFSDSLMQLEYRAHVQPGISVFGVAAMNRIQDETIMKAMGENDWASISLGVRFSW